MNQRSKNKLNMYKAVLAICTQHAADWSSLPPFGAALAQFSAKLSELEQSSYRQSVLTLGVTATRDETLQDTIDLAELIANGLRAYAAGNDNLLLSEQLDFPKRDFHNGGSQSTLNLIDRILELALQHATGVATYGITQQQMSDLAALRQQLGDVIGSPRTAIVGRKQQTLAIAACVDALDALLNEHLDRMIEVLKPTQPVFWQLYKGARVIVDHKGKQHAPGEDDTPPEENGTRPE